MAQVNRYLKDKAFDHIDHALGRPVDPTGETHRNYFADSAGCFEDDPNWQINGVQGDMTFYGVTDAGRLALKEHLKEIGDEHRLYIVSIDGEDMRPMAAKSHGSARYNAHLHLDREETFAEFLKTARVRLAR